MMFGPRTRRALLISAALFLVWPCVGSERSREEPSAIVTSTIVIGGRPAEYPRLSAGLEISARADAHWVRPLVRWPDEDPEYEHRLRELLALYAGKPDVERRKSQEAAD